MWEVSDLSRTCGKLWQMSSAHPYTARTVDSAANRNRITVGNEFVCNANDRTSRRARIDAVTGRSTKNDAKLRDTWWTNVELRRASAAWTAAPAAAASRSMERDEVIRCGLKLLRPRAVRELAKLS